MFGTWPNNTGAIYGFRPVANASNPGEGVLDGADARYQGCALDGAWNSWGGFTINFSKGNATYSGTKLQPSALQALACIRT